MARVTVSAADLHDLLVACRCHAAHAVSTPAFGNLEQALRDTLNVPLAPRSPLTQMSSAVPASPHTTHTDRWVEPLALKPDPGSVAPRSDLFSRRRRSVSPISRYDLPYRERPTFRTAAIDSGDTDEEREIKQESRVKQEFEVKHEFEVKEEVEEKEKPPQHPSDIHVAQHGRPQMLNLAPDSDKDEIPSDRLRFGLSMTAYTTLLGSVCQRNLEGKKCTARNCTDTHLCSMFSRGGVSPIILK